MSAVNRNRHEAVNHALIALDEARRHGDSIVPALEDLYNAGTKSGLLSARNPDEGWDAGYTGLSSFPRPALYCNSTWGCVGGYHGAACPLHVKRSGNG